MRTVGKSGSYNIQVISLINLSVGESVFSNCLPSQVTHAISIFMLAPSVTTLGHLEDCSGNASVLSVYSVEVCMYSTVYFLSYSGSNYRAS